MIHGTAEGKREGAEDDRRGAEAPLDWSRLGRAAEEFAHHIARDAARFAEKVEEHARDLARDVGREWRRAERRPRRARREGGDAEDLRHVFTDVRGLVGEVLDGVDELIERLFPHRAGGAEAPPDAPEPPARPGDDRWSHVVTNRDASCAACGAGIAAGEEAYFRAGARPEFRCAECVPSPTEDRREPS